MRDMSKFNPKVFDVVSIPATFSKQKEPYVQIGGSSDDKSAFFQTVITRFGNEKKYQIEVQSGKQVFNLVCVKFADFFIVARHSSVGLYIYCCSFIDFNYWMNSCNVQVMAIIKDGKLIDGHQFVYEFLEDHIKDISAKICLTH